MGELKKIQLKNFECHEDSELELSKVNILIGENGNGKSSIINALTLGVSGVLPTKPFSDYLKDGADNGSVDIEVITNEGKTRTARKVIGPDGKIKTEQITTASLLEQLGANVDTVRTLVDTWYFVQNASASVRKNVLSTVMSREYTAEELIEALSENIEDDKKDWHKTFITDNFCNLSHAKKTQTEMLYDLAYKARTAAKKDLTAKQEEIKLLETKLSAYKNTDEKVDEESIKRTLEHTELIKDIEYLQKEIDKKDVEYKEYDTKITKFKENIETLTKAITEEVSEEEVKAISDRININKNDIKNFEAFLKKIKESGKSECPTCGSDMDDAIDKFAAKIVVCEEDIKTDEADYNTKNEQYMNSNKLKELNELLAGANTKLEEMAEGIKTSTEDMGNKKLAADELVKAGIVTQEGLDANENAKEIEKLKARLAIYKEDLATLQTDANDLELAVAKYNDSSVWVSLLTTNKEVFVDNLKSIVELLIPKYKVEVDSDMNMTFSGISLNTLSTSEKFRVGVGIQTALSIASGLGIVVIDGSDIVTDPTNLIMTINKLGTMEAIKTLIVTSSYDFTKPEKDKRKKDNVKIEVPATHYVITDGVVERQDDLFGSESW
jgi:DNA repair exonuclease SbcCD ATPase subunit